MNRLLSKFAVESKVLGDAERRTGMYTSVHEDSSTASTTPFASTVEFGKKSKKILIIGPSWVGDMIMAQALFRLIKAQQPDAQLDVLAPSWSQLVVERMPEITKSLCLPIEHGTFGWKQRVAMAKQLRHENYDQAIVLANSWKSALIPWLARIPLRTGWIGELRWGLLNDARYLRKKVLTRMVERYVALGLPANTTLPTDFPLPKLSAPATSVQQSLAKFNLHTDKPVLALCAGAAFGPAKRWPAEYFVQIAQQKIASGWQVWLFGSQQDEPVITSILQQLPATDTKSFAGKLSLLETIDLLSTVNAVVANDSGLLHMAASLDKPVVGIYGSTTPDFSPPLGTKAQVLKEKLPCSPCFKRECRYGHLDCLYKIKPEKVLAAIDELERVS